MTREEAHKLLEACGSCGKPLVNVEVGATTNTYEIYTLGEDTYEEGPTETDWDSWDPFVYRCASGSCYEELSDEQEEAFKMIAGIV